MIATERRERLRLAHLERLVDLVFALLIWRLFMILPRPGPDLPERDSVAGLLAAEWASFVIALPALLIVVYRVQSNTRLGHLRKTDVRHTAMVIFQLFFLLLFLYAIPISIVGGSNVDTRLLESDAALLVGTAAHLAWRYAIQDQRLLHPETTLDENREVTRKAYAEPLTAALTLPFALTSRILWELCWFLYPAVRWAPTRTRHRSKAQGPTA